MEALETKWVASGAKLVAVRAKEGRGFKSRVSGPGSQVEAWGA